MRKRAFPLDFQKDKIAKWWKWSNGLKHRTIFTLFYWSGLIGPLTEWLLSAYGLTYCLFRSCSSSSIRILYMYLEYHSSLMWRCVTQFKYFSHLQLLSSKYILPLVVSLLTVLPFIFPFRFLLLRICVQAKPILQYMPLILG